MQAFLIIGLPFVLSLVLCRWAMTLRILDAPDGARKLQAAPVPRTGGLGLVAAILISLTAFVAILGFSPATFVDVLVANRLSGPAIYLLGLAMTGLADDIFQLPALLKFMILGGLSLIGAALGPWPQDVWLPFVGETALSVYLAVGGAALWLFVVANAVNFMDGANGLAMGTSGVMLLVIAVLLSPVAAVSWEANYIVGLFAVAVIMCAAIAGFLVWNLPGRLYAGDMGALFVGGLVGVFGLLIGQFYSIWLAPLIVLPFLADVLLTMLHRARRGDNILSPHREHAYQFLIRNGWAHVKVAALWWGLAAICGVVALGAVALGLKDGGVRWLHAYSLGAFVFTLGVATVLWFWQRRVIGPALAREGR